MNGTAAPALKASRTSGVAYGVLGAISVAHLLNDMMQSVLLAIYPVLKGSFDLSFAQVGVITLAFQFSSSLLQPLIGHFTDKRPKPYSLPVGMGFTLLGLLLLSQAWNFPSVVVAASLIGMGSSVFHPESSRVARMASAGQHGLAQSIFQVGGNLGSSLGPLLAALIIVPFGQGSVAWFSLAALLAMLILFQVSRWYSYHLNSVRGRSTLAKTDTGLTRRQVVRALAILLVLVFSKYFYLAGLNSYLTFYLMHRFGVSIQDAQYCLFVFLFAVALGTIVGGPVGDRIGRKRVILGSILGAAPFALMLPYANLFWTIALVFVIGIVIASAFSAILVYAQELAPGKTGTISGLFFGLAFGMAGIGAAALGALADATSIEFVYHVCAFLPLLGIAAFLLPNPRHAR
ncbi:MAG: MFS transporter [Pollutimonas bauzanensis]|uniref:MFS transporter, FSR family, fosmidomycin resistance protein n=1 Tax=Pollutimonas bauzanensis TaxID=658167 RepID=A0A1M5NHG1_9BURK|nr:MFS transporter [Pollutimonas bauzanensis]SHG88907.1 MFS transporter, FSR family, fosmidomycin resistance protein [Pollutimonas bauzanensis]